jgi:hypothetical protein
MKISDLYETTFVPKYIRDWYLQRGFTHVAKGDAADVYKKGNIIFKVYGTDVNGSGAGADQKMVSLFVLYCKKYSNSNPYLPRFGEVKFIDEKKKFLEVQSEVLTPGGELAEALSEYYMYNGWAAEQKHADAAHNIISKVMSDKELEKFLNTIYHLNRLGGRKIYNDDINEANIMMRGNTPVINDPWTLGF